MIKKWVVFIVQKKRRTDFVTAIFLVFAQLVRHPFVELFDFLIWCKCRTAVDWSTSSSSATSRVVLRGSASIMVLSSRLCYEIFETILELYIR
uniref:Ovule protein n=1 Tax=Heterorhabditis bacteriophora TaxID=37862 RepID=A0A1I7X1C5_HETBA